MGWSFFRCCCACTMPFKGLACGTCVGIIRLDPGFGVGDISIESIQLPVVDAPHDDLVLSPELSVSDEPISEGLAIDLLDIDGLRLHLREVVGQDLAHIIVLIAAWPARLSTCGCRRRLHLCLGLRHDWVSRCTTVWILG